MYEHVSSNPVIYLNYTEKNIESSGGNSFLKDTTAESFNTQVSRAFLHGAEICHLCTSYDAFFWKICTYDTDCCIIYSALGERLTLAVTVLASV
jgi:hypothetical protein